MGAVGIYTYSQKFKTVQQIMAGRQEFPFLGCMSRDDLMALTPEVQSIRYRLCHERPV